MTFMLSSKVFHWSEEGEMVDDRWNKSSKDVNLKLGEVFIRDWFIILFSIVLYMFKNFSSSKLKYKQQKPY